MCVCVVRNSQAISCYLLCTRIATICIKISAQANIYCRNGCKYTGERCHFKWFAGASQARTAARWDILEKEYLL